MRRPLIATALVLATTVMLVPETGLTQGKSQQQVPLPPGGFKPPPMAPIKPYPAVAVTLPVPNTDPSFAAFRTQLAAVAQHKDRAALAKLIVAQGFFWMQDKDMADKRKPGIANLASAIDLDAKDNSGWEMLAAYATDPTGQQLPDHQNVICAPAEPNVDPKAFDELMKSTHTEPPEWGFPATDGVEVRSAAKPDAPVIEKLGLTLLRVLPDNGPPPEGSQQQFLHIATPSGKAGFIPFDAMSSLGGDQMCYTKDASGWKIAGYLGGASQ